MEIVRAQPFWNLEGFSWTLMGLLIAGTVVLTIGFVVWTVLQPEEPDHDTSDLVDKATSRDRDTARTIRRRMDADSGRADPSEPDLR